MRSHNNYGYMLTDKWLLHKIKKKYDNQASKAKNEAIYEAKRLHI